MYRRSYARQALLMVLPTVLLAGGGTALGAERLTVQHVLAESDAACVFAVGDCWIVREGVAEFDGGAGAYNGIGQRLVDETWYLVFRREGVWQPVALADENHQPIQWFGVKSRKADREASLVAMLDQSPVIVNGQDVGTPARPPVEFFVATPDGKVQELSRSGLNIAVSATGGLTPPEETVLARVYPRLETVRAPKELGLKFRELAPYPKGPLPVGSAPIVNPDGKVIQTETGFPMWENAGRPRSPGLAHFKGDGLSVTLSGKTRQFNGENGLPSNLVSCAHAKDAAAILAGFFDAGLVRVSPESGQVTAIETSGGKPLCGISLVDEDPSGGLWVGTFTQGLYVRPRGANALERVEKVPPCRVNDLRIAGRTIMAATSSGLYVLALDGGE